MWRSSLEDKWGVELDTEYRIWPWLAEWAGWLTSSAEVGADRNTGYETSKGKTAKLPVMEFGEGVMWKRGRESKRAVGKAELHVGRRHIPGSERGRQAR